MKRAAVLLTVATALTATAAFAADYVRGYTRRDGTYASHTIGVSRTNTATTTIPANTNPPAYNQSYGKGER
ncbi:MAG TPA: hypothetical protein DEQ20_00890 [Desulfobulbaceae bacterium]|nr:MAG: hypothetical protein A2520_06110 [Deltaproteobacteria bacterium RIFOXYD12_FULL_53_23]HCC53473.1 hypothetical protein [Desulfobulbaceae bacterium]